MTGAGVTLNVTADQSGKPLSRITWDGLLRNAIAYLVEKGHEDTAARWIQRTYDALDDPEGGGLLDVAYIMSGRMKQHGQFSKWLELVFGSLGQESCSYRRAEGVAQSGATLLTTNYDDVLEKHCGLRCVGRSNKYDLTNFMGGDADRVLHIHGSYQDGDDVMLDTIPYYDARTSDRVQDILKMLLQTKTILFVGCRGVNDPNFDALMRWVKRHDP